MAKLQSVDDLRDYAYRNLGAPKIEIQVDDSQAYDRIDDALQLFVERHFDGAEEKFITIEFTADDETNEYLTLGDDIVAVTRIYEPGRYSSEAMSDVRYRIMADEMFDMTKVNMQYYENSSLMSYENIIKTLNSCEITKIDYMGVKLLPTASCVHGTGSVPVVSSSSSSKSIPRKDNHPLIVSQISFTVSFTV